MDLLQDPPVPIAVSDDDLLKNCPPVEIPPLEVPFHLTEDNGPRLVISQVVVENFKSYGGRRVLGPFHKNFTCIIGPNGSGKSNVIDALLFVFGFRASKVRSKKLSSLIHNSDELPNVDFCQVAVHFQRIIDTGSGAADYEVVPNSEFVVSRKAFKDNSNSYYVNDCKASFKEVTGLLRQHGIDLDHNRFLILQGEVEQISLMKPKAMTEHETGFLEYLEDIIGSNRYKKPLSILADRIERLKDIRLEKLARVKAVEKERNELEAVKDEAVAYLRLLNKMTRIKNIIYQKNQLKERELEAKNLEELVEVEKQVEEFASSIKGLAEAVQELKAQRDSNEAQSAQLSESYRTAKTRFAGFEAEDAEVREAHAHAKKSGKRAVRALATERERLSELRRLPDEASSRRQALTAALADFEAQKAKQEAILNETMAILAQETAPLRRKMEAAETALAPVQKAADEAASDLAIAQQELDLALSAFKREEERALEAKSAVEATQTRLADRERQLAEAKRQITPKDLQSAQKDLEKATQEEKSLTEKVHTLRSSLVEAKTTFQSDSSRSRVLGALTTAMREGKLKGILGRLGDLGVIPQKFDVAISTSCGALDHIVVETMELAQRAVEFLKRHNLGQASFIALDKMSRWETEAAKAFVGPVPAARRLFDLVDTSANPRVRPCFFFALRNTLIADNLEIALDWAFKHKQRFRVVTLQGELIETSGAMSGGGRGRPISGRMTTDTQKARRASAAVAPMTESDIAAKEKELAAAEGQLGRLRSHREHLEDTVNRLSHRIQEAERLVTKCQNEIERLQEESRVLQKEAMQAEERAKQTGPSPQERWKKEAAVEGLQKLHASKATKAEELRRKVEEIKEELRNAGSARVAAVRSRVTLIESQIKKTNDQLTKLEVDIKSAERNQAKCEAKIKSLEEEVESLKTKLAEIEARMGDIEKNAKVCMEEFQELQKKIKELSEETAKISGELEKSEAALAAKRKDGAAVQRRAEELQTAAKEASVRARGWQQRLKGLQLHPIDDEDEEEEEEEEEEKGEEGERSAESGESKKGDKKAALKLPVFTAEQLSEMRVNEGEVKRLEEETAAMAPNMAAIEQYRRKVDLYLTRVNELDYVTELRADQLRQEAEAKARRLSEFMAGFNVITTKLKEMYQMLTQGGDAELELIDSLDPFSEGIVFSVRPPKKTWKSIANLSGGEKTLSSLALVFALHHYKPTPLYVMDEIDAALDFKNVSIVGNYVVDRTKDAQFIIISLRNNMFELADRLVGIYKTHNITKSIAIDCADLSKRLEAGIVARCGYRPVEVRPIQRVPLTRPMTIVTESIINGNSNNQLQQQQPSSSAATSTTDNEPARSTCSTESASTFVPQANS